MQCYACDHQATRQCRRCARVYCELHGGDLCAECLSPVSSLPSFNLYRGSLLALLVGTAVALWLIVRPPGSSSGDQILLSQLTPTAAVTQTTRTTTPASTALATPTIGALATSTPVPPPAATPGPRPYVVQDGDTLIGIATQFAPPGADPYTYAQQIAAASGMSDISEPISVGQTLTLP
jgi:hypothetical protein